MRLLRRALISLAIGVLASIGVAWMLALTVDMPAVTRQTALAPFVSDVGTDPFVRAMTFTEALGSIGASGFRMHIRVLDTGLGSDSLFQQSDAWDDLYYAEARGWPFLCAWCGAREVGSPHAPMYTTTGGFTIDAIRRQRALFSDGPAVLPYRPLWTGLALNTLIYAAACFAIPSATSILRQRRRAKAGRCAHCGYALAGIPAGSPCPECGVR